MPGSPPEYYKRHYRENADVYKARAVLSKAAYRKRNADYVYAWLLKHPCKDCGEPDPIVLEFDHVRGVKTSNVANLVQNAVSLKRLQEEIDKCEVRCANCHRRKTHFRRIYGDVAQSGRAPE